MRFEQMYVERGCCSYFIGCQDTRQAALIDPEIELVDAYLALASSEGMTLRYLVDTHTHADHFSALRELRTRMGLPTVMHRGSAAPFVDMHVDDGEMLHVGRLRLRMMHTPGHTADSMCVVMDDRVLTGDTLLIGACGRTDLPTGDPGQLYDSLFGKLLKLPDETLVFPAHDYRRRGHTTIGAEKVSNARLQVKDRDDFIRKMTELELGMPTHLTEALRVNQNGGRTVHEMLESAARSVPFMALDELASRITGAGEADLVVVDVREADAWRAGHVPGAIHVPRGQLELRADSVLPDPTVRIVTLCEFGKISTLAAATLRTMGFTRVVALEGGMKQWTEAGHPVEAAD